MTEEDDLMQELKKLPGNRPAEDRRETKESDLKVRSLLNYPEVQRAFVELAKGYANSKRSWSNSRTSKNK